MESFLKCYSIEVKFTVIMSDLFYSTVAGLKVAWLNNSHYNSDP